jgi:hypothetical protein
MSRVTWARVMYFMVNSTNVRPASEFDMPD